MRPSSRSGRQTRTDHATALSPPSGQRKGRDCLGELPGPLCSPFHEAPHLGESGGHPAVVDVAPRRSHPADRILEDVGGFLDSLVCHALAFSCRERQCQRCSSRTVPSVQRQILHVGLRRADVRGVELVLLAPKGRVCGAPT
jgi:hypothetical protein